LRDSGIAGLDKLLLALSRRALIARMNPDRSYARDNAMHQGATREKKRRAELWVVHESRTRIGAIRVNQGHPRCRLGRSSTQMGEQSPKFPEELFEKSLALFCQCHQRRVSVISVPSSAAPQGYFFGEKSGYDEPSR